MKKYIIIGIVVICLVLSGFATAKIVIDNRRKEAAEASSEVSKNNFQESDNEYKYYEGDATDENDITDDESETGDIQIYDGPAPTTVPEDESFVGIVTTTEKPTEKITEKPTEKVTEKATEATKAPSEKSTTEKVSTTKSPYEQSMKDDFVLAVSANQYSSPSYILKQIGMPYTVNSPTRITVKSGKCTIPACSTELSGVKEAYYVTAKGTEPFYAYCFRLDGSVDSATFQKNLYNNAIARPDTTKMAAKNRFICSCGGYIFFAIYP